MVSCGRWRRKPERNWMMPVAWAEKLKKNWAGVRLGHEAVMLEKIQQEAALTRRLVRKTQDGTLGKASDEPEDAEADMGVAIGNEVHYHYGVEPTAIQPVAPQAGVVGTEAVGSGDAKPAAPAAPLWKTVAKAAAIVAATGSLPLAGIGLHSMLSGPETPPAAAVEAQPLDLTGYGVVVEKATQGEADPFTP